jgi:benzoyl-CoA reductase/2-hydroxyglutaryl-CoA dehydratase subunit BcrC/BadD/HgdB
MLFQYIANLTGAPCVIIDAPYYSNQRAFDYYKTELINAYKDLGSMSGNELDLDKLRQIVHRTNEQLKYIYKLQELRKITPCPDPAMHRPMDFAMYTIFGFSEKVVDYFRIVYDEAKERADKGLGVIPEDKKEIRTLWTWGFEGYDLSIYHWMEEEYGATYLECGITFLPEDQIGLIDDHNMDSMIEGLARLTFNYPMSRQVTSYADIWINDFTRLARSHHADCAIFAGNVSCKHAWALNKLLSDAIREEAHIPTLRFEMDIADKRFTPAAEVKKNLAEFFETIKK